MKLLLIVILLIPLSLFGQRKQGLPLIDSLLSELAVSKEDTNKVIIKNLISYSYSTIEPSKGLKHAQEALLLAKHLKWSRGIATAHSSLGTNYAAISKNKDAVEHYMRSIKIFDRIGNQRGAAGVTANLSLLYKSQSNYPKALEYAFKALKTSEQFGDTARVTLIKENIGTIYLEQKDHVKALEYYRQALRANENLKNKAGIARCQGNIGIVYGAMGDHKKALKYHLSALKIKAEQGNKYAIQNGLANIGIAYMNLKDYPQAFKNHFKALKISEEIGSKHNSAINLGNIGSTYLTLASDSITSIRPGEYVQSSRSANLHLAIQHLQNAVKVCREISFYGPMIEFTDALSRAYMLSKQYQKALDAFKEYTVLKDSVYSQESSIALTNLETQRELELKDRDIIIQKNEIEIAKLKAANKRNERTLYLSGTFILLLIIGFAIQKSRKLIKMQRTALEDISQIQSHNIRGPVARIIGLAHLFNREDYSDPVNKEVVDHLLTVTTELDDIVRKIIGKTHVEKE